MEAQELYDFTVETIKKAEKIAFQQVCPNCKLNCKLNKKCDNQEKRWHRIRNITIAETRKFLKLSKHGDLPMDLFCYINRAVTAIITDGNDTGILRNAGRIARKLSAGTLKTEKKIKCKTCGHEVWPSKIYKNYKNEKDADNGRCYRCIKGDEFTPVPDKKTEKNNRVEKCTDVTHEKPKAKIISFKRIFDVFSGNKKTGGAS